MTDAEFADALAAHGVPGAGLHSARFQGMIDAVLYRLVPQHHRLTAAAGEWSGCSLLSMARAALEGQDVDTRVGPAELAGMALNLTAVTTRSGYATTSDFPSILASVGRVTLTQGYTLAPRTFQDWTRRTTLPDFRTAYRVSLSTGPQLLEVPEHGEYTRAARSARGRSRSRCGSSARYSPSPARRWSTTTSASSSASRSSSARAPRRSRAMWSTAS